MSPKVIQIAVDPVSRFHDGGLYLLFDNGDVWYRFRDHLNGWIPINVPQYDKEEEMSNE